MGKIIVSVSYEINPDQREEYIALMQQVKKQIKSAAKQNYDVYEDADRPNLMTEIYYVENEKEIQEIKKRQQDKTESLLSQIDNFLVDQEQVAIRTFKVLI